MRSAALGLAVSVSVLAQPATLYRLRYAHAGSPTVEVTIEFPEPVAAPAILVMPRAIPMGYAEQPYDRFVDNVTASSSGSALRITREDGPRWRVGQNGQRVARIGYRVDIARMERELLAASDTSKLRAGYLGLLGYSVFAYVDGLESLRARLRVEMPENWPVLTTLAPRAPPPVTRVEAEAADFYALADSQIAAGPALRVRRVEARAPLYLSLYAELDTDAEAVATAAREAMDALVEWFGSAPFPHYTIMMELLKPVSAAHRYGFSMEHMDSGTFSLDENLELPRHRFNFAHHIAHSWIPKRCAPPGYFPFSWELAPVLDDIWFAEGFGQYAAMAAIRDTLPEAARAAYIDRMLERFRGGLRDAPPFLKRMPLAELSRIASTRYAEDFRTGRTVFSRGGMMAYEMDEAIRRETRGAKSLRDALRHLVAWSAREKRPFRVDDLPVRFQEATGVDTRAILQRWLAPMRE